MLIAALMASAAMAATACACAHGIGASAAPSPHDHSAMHADHGDFAAAVAPPGQCQGDCTDNHTGVACADGSLTSVPAGKVVATSGTVHPLHGITASAMTFEPPRGPGIVALQPATPTGGLISRSTLVALHVLLLN